MKRESEAEQKSGNHPSEIRPYDPGDILSLVKIAHANFDSPAYSLYPLSVVEAYKRANSPDDLSDTFAKNGTEAYVLTDGEGSIDAYYVLRPTRQDDGLLMDIRRMQIAPEAQGKGLAGQILASAESRARELGARRISIHAGGASRNYFEKKGWNGSTVLVDFKPFPAVTFYCSKDIASDEAGDSRHEADTIVWAGTNQRKINHLRQIVPSSVPILATPAEEEKDTDVLNAAKSKIESAKKNTDSYNSKTAFISTDVLNHILAYDEAAQKYTFKGRLKPETPEDAADNFAQMLRHSSESGKPTPYVLKCATVIEIDGVQVTKLVDTSIWLSQSMLEYLSTMQGFTQYREEVLSKYGRDVLDNSAGFAFPYFLDHGGVMGINGVPIEDIKDITEVSQGVIKIAHGSPDPDLLNKVLKF